MTTIVLTRERQTAPSPFGCVGVNNWTISPLWAVDDHHCSHLRVPDGSLSLWERWGEQLDYIAIMGGR
ncbi:hypothetical protein FHU10_3308 [Serratia fonticola]|uniref:Uncharacterized protein n=1 Tax=Serratia fonticola TaxID=47917 RepID=A0A559T7Y1_SERFO|nr:hypothetical protein FHU09_4401 [Serratia fonticola]TQI96219.1 hypothetical protein FHU11_1647 [Serratia fonticola]TVZ70716.1 hypothetical protein FHU10_3308 [Serratia fonticola]